ncbi:HNH endonuclease [Cryptosporangium aurantiacum]|uniref:HNH endonuclease n=2 Tax=Cryptosporangium aurantiacum TaxID=134849 RepID=A0A1M7RI43_9ACTN|nr:HNH endonuclease [Cryptosporangium aurantiacum]
MDVMDAGREVMPVVTDGVGRADRLAARIARDGASCVWCGREFGRLVRATTDHLVPRVKGGPSWLENELAACGRCNRARGHRGAAEWADECERLGWPVDRTLLARTLRELEGAIERRGGQRRARAQIVTQLRRLEI